MFTHTQETGVNTAQSRRQSRNHGSILKNPAMNIDCTKLDFVAGISPQYWAHVCMSVIDVLKLKLKDGINWMPSPPSDGEYVSPVSKCLLVGYIVYAAERRDGSMVYVVDDGTGLIDCVHWSSDTQDIYQLPPLEEVDGDDNRFSVGEPVRVFGKIECLATTTTKGGDKDLVVREIQASLIERVENDLTSEAHHWMRLCNCAPDNIHSCLDAVGPQIQSQINDKVNLPAADDMYSCSWRVFGVNCCCKLTYMEKLLYCHCQCKAEPLDPSYRFRDAVLHMLLSMEERTTKRLEFKYNEIKNNEHLQKMASREITAEKSLKKDTLIDNLFLKTFRALRHDGIIYLLNSNTDIYLLITRDKVLEPYILSQIEMESEIGSKRKNFVNYERAPPYILRVHNERLLYIKRLLEQKERMVLVQGDVKKIECP